jgi:hypothetical protein
MATPDRILSPDLDLFERRSKKRTTINHGALLFLRATPAFTLAVSATLRTTERAFG